MNYELFISYARKDNVPQGNDTRGWVTALRDEIIADHRRFSTEPLRIFFDTAEIHDLDDWRHRILESLRTSRILLVCLSPHYFRSEACRWEWEEYLKRQVHTLIGHESIAPVYFVEVPGSDEQRNAAAFDHWVAGIQPWLDGVLRPNFTDLRPFFPNGLAALQEAEVRRRMEALGTGLWERIERARRATAVPGNLNRLNPHFVGRRRELKDLHEQLALGAVGVVTAVHGLGGQGKTELATAYAHGWADCYPAGLWVLRAEGHSELLPLLGELCQELQIPLALSPQETADQRGRRVLAELQRRADQAAARDPRRTAACLVILDNVSDPRLLADPQLAQLPREPWLRIVATTREGPERFPGSRQKSLAFVAVDALSDDDAARLIEDHQLDGHWPHSTATADIAAAREIARELGGFTLAVESVAIYLGLHPDLRPADYLARLRSEGLPSVDDLPADADVAAQMQHREKQLRRVLDQTLSRLTPPEQTALNYAALLPPESIPWPWLQALVVAEHPDELAARPGYPDPWPALRRRIEGLRLLTSGDRPQLARLHRLVAAHLRARLGTRAVDDLRRLRNKVERFALALQYQWRHDPTTLWQLVPLQEAVRHWRDGEHDRALGHIAGIVGDIEATVGRLDTAEAFLRLAVVTTEALLRDHPTEYSARDVSVSLGRLGDFLARRAQPVDAEQALAHFERSLAVAETLLQAHPDSAMLARDVSVILAKLGTFLTRRAQPGDAEQALAHFERSLEVAKSLLQANPDSAQAARDVSISLESLGEFLARRAQPGDAEQALAHFERSLEIKEKLLQANSDSAEAARDVSVSLIKLGEFLARRDQPGDAEQALAYFERCHEVVKKLLQANPDSTEAARDVMVSHFKLFQVYRQLENQARAIESLTACFAILDSFAQQGRPMDGDMRQLYAELRPMFRP